MVYVMQLMAAVRNQKFTNRSAARHRIYLRSAQRRATCARRGTGRKLCMIMENSLLSYRRSAPALLAAALALTAVEQAHAEDCASLQNPVFVAGSSAAKPFIAQVAVELKKQSTPITVV